MRMSFELESGSKIGLNATTSLRASTVPSHLMQIITSNMATISEMITDFD